MQERKKSKNLFIGIDPGLTGAIAVLDDSGKCLFLSDCPTEKKSVKIAVSPKGISQLMADIKKLKGKIHALLEEPIAMPKNGRAMGVSSMLSYGRGVGVWEGALSSTGIEFDTVHPRVWKSKLLPSQRRDKSNSIKAAKKLFPDARKKLANRKHHGRAEALLIAYYLSTLFNGGRIENQKIH